MTYTTRLSRMVCVLSLLLILFLSFTLDVTPTSAASPIIVNTTADEDFYNKTCSLREAVEAANAGADYGGCVYDGRRIISLQAGTYTVDHGMLPSITEDITINGISPTETIIQSSDCNPVTDICSQDYILFYIAGIPRSLTLNNLTIRHAQSHDKNGSAIYNNGGTLIISNSVITANRSEKGGAILNNNYATLSITNSTFSSNTATSAYLGGAIYNTSNSTVTIIKSTFSGNKALCGGAIFNEGTLGITNSTFSGNEADQDGGAIYNKDVVSITHGTFSGNAAVSQGAGIYNGGGTLNFSNTIIANPISGDDCRNNLGTIGINHNNLVEDGSCSAAFSGDPILGPLADNGGPTLTHALLPGSLAINNGYLAACSATDQRGIERPQGPGCDIGAYEMVYSSSFLPLIMK
jgi:CSLREA domain-containing protein